MMIKSSQRSGYRELAIHLASGENEKVTVMNSRGVISEDILGALEEFEATAIVSNCQKHLFHVSASPAPDEQMNDKYWSRLWQYHEKINGLKNASFIEVEHEKNDRTHRHRVYERVDYETGKAVNLSWTRLKNEQLSRMTEASFGHKIIQGKFNKAVIRHLKKDGFDKIAALLEQSGIADREQRVTQITHGENQQIKRGFDLKAARCHVADCWAQSDSPAAFKAALAEAGYQMAEGDKMGVPVVVDAAGHVIPLQRGINAHRKAGGLNSIKKKEFMKMIAHPLPDMDAVREQLPEQQQTTTLDNEVKPMLSNSFPKVPTQQTHKGKISRGSESKKTQSYDKKSLLQEIYGERAQNLELSRYWRADRLADGSLQFKNRIGKIIDTGDTIDVATIGKQAPVASAAMQLASLKKWGEIKITGTDQFKLAAMGEAIKQGIKVKIENENDRVLYQRALEVEEKNLAKNNRIEKIEEAETEVKKEQIDVSDFFDDEPSPDDDHQTDTTQSQSPRIK